MSHLPAERLAALADHSHCPELAPTPAERVHLDTCASCTREVNVYGRLVDAAQREVERDAEPLAPWATIAAALRSEGLIVENGGESRIAGRDSGNTSAERGAPSVDIQPLDARRSVPSSPRWAGRVAAGLMLVAAGAVAGRATAGRAAGTATPAPTELVAHAGRPASPNALSVVNLVADTALRFASTAEALTALTSAERQYERAAAFLVENDSSSQPTDSSQLYRARLAALDNVMAATREALYDAPHDPLINRYYLATMGAREATLRQLGTSLPQGERISRY